MILLNGRVKTVCTDITTLKCDAIVNAANSTLYGGGGVDGAIHNAAGPELLNACRIVRKKLYPEGLPTGQAVLTGAGRLPFAGVIHTVGPVWKGGDSNEESLLASCYRNSLSIAREKGFKTLAFPAVSTGVYGYPPQKAAQTVLSVLKEFTENSQRPETVYLVFFTPSAERIFLSEAEKSLSFPDKRWTL